MLFLRLNHVGLGERKLLKRIVSGIMLTLLLIGMLTIVSCIRSVKGTSDWIAVFPDHYEGSFVGEEFTIKINVSVSWTAGLAGFEYKFRWNNTLLEVVSHTITPPWTGYFIGANTTTDLGDGRDQHFLGVSSLPVTGWTGNTTICTYTFRVKYRPYFPEPDGYSLLDLVETKFASPVCNFPPHDEYDGEYTIKALAHDVAVTNITTKTIVGQNYSTSINMTIENQGIFIETFNVTVYINETEIYTKEITLTSGSSTTLTFEWNTTGWDKGNYTISAIADTVPGETDTLDNEYTVVVRIVIPGDVNCDRTVDINDLIIWSNAYGSRPGYPNWNPLADLNGDEIIDVFDGVIIAINYGKTYP
jgi:hypothetical protein